MVRICRIPAPLLARAAWAGLIVLAAAGLIALGACGGGGSPSNPSPQPTPVPAPQPTPTPTPTPNPNPTPTPSPSSATVTITSSGVSPKSVTISVGGRVTFVNNSSQFHEMLSDPHPQHTDCPPMDDIGALAPGQSRQTGVFTIARTCGYHDHGQPGNASLQGTIVIQ